MDRGLERLNNLSQGEAEAELLKCCGSTAWARAVAARRPFADEGELMKAAEEVWSNLEAEDWLEAFGRHPKIGERKAAAQSGQERAWSEQEQARASAAGESERARLVELNGEYERKFGYIFIVCATGKSGAQILASLESRIKNDPAAEIANAAEEQRLITRLRLRKLLEA